MKPISKILLNSVAPIGLPFARSSCVTAGYAGFRNGVYYGPRRDPWFNDDPWREGHRWYRGPRGPQVDTTIGIYIHPPRHRW